MLMIRSFKGKFAEPILQGRMIPKGFPANLVKVARRKLIMVDPAGFILRGGVRAMQIARTGYLVTYSLIPDATSKAWFRWRDILPP